MQVILAGNPVNCNLEPRQEFKKKSNYLVFISVLADLRLLIQFTQNCVHFIKTSSFGKRPYLEKSLYPTMCPIKVFEQVFEIADIIILHLIDQQ